MKNLTNSCVAVRTKTTKKDVYAVNPTYGVIQPNGVLDIKFVYFIKDLKDDPKKHKFKFEGIIVENSTTEKDVKGVFENLISNRIPSKGNAIKREVAFNYVTSKNENKPQANTPNNVEPSENRRNDSIPNSKAPLNKINGNDKQAETQLQDLKMELHKYKNQLNSVQETHKNLKNRVEMEKSKDMQASINSKININFSFDSFS